MHAGETRSLAFLAKSPLGKVPLLEDEGAGLVLPESGAILTYLAEKYADRVPDHWLPRWGPPIGISTQPIAGQGSVLMRCAMLMTGLAVLGVLRPAWSYEGVQHAFSLGGAFSLGWLTGHCMHVACGKETASLVGALLAAGRQHRGP